MKTLTDPTDPAPDRRVFFSRGKIGEPLTAAHLVTFGCIWIALAIFTADQIRKARS